MKLIRILKNRNRILLEVNTGVLFWSVVAAAAGMLFPLQAWGIGRLDWCLCIGTAMLLAMLSMLHRRKCLDRALDFDEGTATKLIFRGYLIRYISFAVILIIAALSGVLNPLVLCLGYLLIIKAAVYSQPFSHKLYNRLFCEKDPVPEPVEEQSQI